MDHADDPLATLHRWEASGGHWRVLGRTARSRTVGLYTCDGGEQVGGFSSDDPALTAYVDGAGVRDG